MRPRPVAAVLVAALAAAAGGCGGAGSASAPAAGARTQATASSAGGARATAAIDPWEHLRALADVGARHRGTRAAGTPGGVATEDVIARRLRAAGWSVRFEAVPFPFFSERRPPAVTLRGGR